MEKLADPATEPEVAKLQQEANVLQGKVQEVGSRLRTMEHAFHQGYQPKVAQADLDQVEAEKAALWARLDAIPREIKELRERQADPQGDAPAA